MPNVICPCGYSVPKGTKCDCRQKASTARKANDESHGSAASRGYDKDWFRLRASFLAANPICCVCGSRASHVDHIKSVREAPLLRLATSNLRSICGPCHSRRTARDQSQAWGKKG